MRTYDAHETERMHQVHGAQLASFKARLLAFSIDFLAAFFIFVLTLILGSRLLALLGFLNSDANVNLKFDLQHWYSLLFIVVYFGLSTYLGNGQTIGKRLLGIRVVSLVHKRMSLWHSFERALGYGASALEFGFGFMQYFIHPNRRTVHDRIAETIVIKEDRKKRAAVVDKKHTRSLKTTARKHASQDGS